MRRTDKEQLNQFRKRNRIFKDTRGWFIETREKDIGPFASKDDAEEELLALSAKFFAIKHGIVEPQGDYIPSCEREAWGSINEINIKDIKL